jgi:predicted DNA-binding transcriptional regulator YafY
MAPRLSRLERMTNLVLALLETSRPMSLREIGSVVAGYPSGPGPLRQAFERDKRTLRDGGIPIAVERIDGEEQVGYTIVPEEYYLPDLNLTEAETEAIGFALAAVRLEGTAGSEVAEKLGAEWPDIPPLAVLPSLDALGPLQEAVRRRSVAHFTYRGKARAVEGDALVFSNGAWYLHGPDRAADPPGAVRTFRVDRIDSAIEFGDGGEYETSPLPATSRRDTADGEGLTEAIVEIDRRHAASVTGLAGRAAIVRRGSDGSVTVKMPVSDENAFISFILGLGESAVVVSPPSLRSAIIGRLEGAVGS